MKILVPTDFSNNSIQALEYATHLAKKLKASLCLLHVYKLAVGADLKNNNELGKLFSGREKTENTQLNSLSEKINKTEKLTCDWINKQGKTVDVILEKIKEKKPALVIMGTKGASGIKKSMMGSNTSRVIEKSPCPVIAVPEMNRRTKISKIVFATEYLKYDFEVIKFLVKLAKPFKASIDVIHIADGELTRFNEEDNINQFKLSVDKKIRYEAMTYHLLFGKNTEDRLLHYPEKVSADLLVLSTKHRNTFQNFFNKSLTGKISFHSTVPILSFPVKASYPMF